VCARLHVPSRVPMHSDRIVLLLLAAPPSTVVVYGRACVLSYDREVKEARERERERERERRNTHQRLCSILWTWMELLTSDRFLNAHSG
jgi:hypothetical protein